MTVIKVERVKEGRSISMTLTINSFKRWYLIHKWTSLICTIFLFMLCVTGLPLVFGEEIDHWFGTAVEPPNLEAGATRVNLDVIIADALARRPGEHIQFVFQDEDAPAWFVSMGVTPDAMENSAVYKYDGRTGALLQDVPLRQGFMHVMLKLHVDLFTRRTGVFPSESAFR